jgi:lipid II isoglutaminyl synthase (glutamine-hydrolysing)
MELKIAHLYPDHLNLYGDRGNVLCLVQRCLWRNIQASVAAINFGDTIDPEIYDLYFIGGGQDTQQIRVCDDLHRNKASLLKEAVSNGAVFLTICGGYQLLGHYYKPHHGNELRGLSLIDAYTVAGDTRMIGNITISRTGQDGVLQTHPGLNEEDTTWVVGFENHSGQTFLGAGVSPLGTVISGHGNNGQDKTEGARVGRLYGTYLHGSLLPKNPVLADELIEQALSRRYGTIALSLLPDRLELAAHRRAVLLKP